MPNVDRGPAEILRRTWEEPQIVMERLLLASAQEGDPGAPTIPGAPPVGPQGILGPLNSSGDSGECLNQ